MKISAVLLAGGKSRRMGRDKARIVFRGKPLWQLQLDLLRKLEPAEILISARTDPSWRPNDLQFVADGSPSRGPLSGLAASLGQMRGTHLLALAIDMPFMSERHLRAWPGQIEPGRGVLPMIGDRAEPLAAVYPREANVDLAAALAGDDFSLQSLTKRLVLVGRLRPVSVEQKDAELYRSLNEPADLSIE
jgi:molybdopterin-guanine dinucleotide biosynthesis protein A